MLILGCRVDDVDASEATTLVLSYARSEAASQVVTLGTEMVVYAQRDAQFRAIVNASALSLCDTVGLLWAARRRGARLRGRVTGVELIERLCEAAVREGIGIYFLGGTDGVAAEAASRLRERHPGLIVSGTRGGYFMESESESVAQTIAHSGARILFCGLGFPRQELWIAKHLPASGCGAGVGIGGSLDVISGRVRRAPQAWRRLGLEWLYRLVTQPTRWRRQLALPIFVVLVVLDALGLRRAKRTQD